MSLRQVISGAQIGADIAGLRAAKACGLETGGFIPKGGRTLDGPLQQDWIDHYGLVETESWGYPERTRKNVLASDATIRFAYDFSSAGERATLRFIKELSKPYFDVPIDGLDYTIKLPPAVTALFIKEHDVSILNIAGNGNRSIELVVQHHLMQVFTLLRK